MYFEDCRNNSDRDKYGLCAAGLGKCEPDCVFYMKVNKLTNAALREKAEREKGCTHCQKPYVSIGGINEDKAIIYLGAERPHTKGNVEYLHHMDSAGRMNAFKVRYCPMCGKQLEVKREAD